MSEHDTHRQLLNATKLLLQRLEARGENSFCPMTQADWVIVTKVMRAIAESREALAPRTNLKQYFTNSHETCRQHRHS